MTLRVLHVLEPATGGVPAYVDRLGGHLAELGVEQVVLGSNELEPWRPAMEKWSQSLHAVPWRRRSLDTVRQTGRIRDLVQAGDIDLVHAHSTFAGVASRVRDVGAPVVYQPHCWGFSSTTSGLAGRVIKGVEALLAPRAEVTLLLSRSEEADAPRAGTGQRVGPIVELSDFGPRPEVERDAIRASLGWADDDRIHLCVGELSTRKNQVDLARCWRQQAGARQRLVLVGDGARRAAVEAEALGVDTIDVLGWRGDTAELMAAADALVIASHGEGFALVIVEALVSGLPVFATEIGGVEVLRPEDGSTGSSVQEMVKAVLSSSLVGGVSTTRQARARYHRSRFSSADAAARMLEIYQTTVHQ